MRRTASEIIHNLEMRIARLERIAKQPKRMQRSRKGVKLKPKTAEKILKIMRKKFPEDAVGLEARHLKIKGESISQPNDTHKLLVKIGRKYWAAVLLSGEGRVDSVKSKHVSRDQGVPFEEMFEGGDSNYHNL